jgi:general secretion pathway protein L
MNSAILSRPTIAAGQLIRRGVAWWLAELAQLVPRRMLRVVSSAGEPASVLQFSAREPVLLVSDRRQTSPIVLPLARFGEHERRMRVRSVLRSHRADDTVAVSLDPSLIFETSIDLPLAAEGSLDAILRHQIERLVPLSAAETCFAYRIAARVPAAGILKVRLIIAKNSTIEACLGAASAAGLNPRLIIAQQAEGVPGDRIVLWRAGSGLTAVAGHRRLQHALEIAAIVLALLSYGLYVHRLDRIRDDLQARIAHAKPVAAAVQNLAQQVGQANEALSFFQSRRNEVPPLAILDELTRLVPTDSWVKQLSVRGRAVEIDGNSPRATDLVSQVDGSAVFENPHFRSPITLAPDGKSERFDLSLDIKAPPPNSPSAAPSLPSPASGGGSGWGPEPAR